MRYWLSVVALMTLGCGGGASPVKPTPLSAPPVVSQQPEDPCAALVQSGPTSEALAAFLEKMKGRNSGFTGGLDASNWERLCQGLSH